ncbi:MAG: hypothetical protein J6T74_10040, partial [Clostridia bacterium]|nr:hypothetical protein [Clostridia bacterium]
EMCWVLNISPQEVHSEKQIEHKYNVFSAKIGNGSITYDDDDFDDEDVLYNAYDYFCENIDEINDYINLNNPTDIKKRYHYYLDVSGKENISE